MHTTNKALRDALDSDEITFQDFMDAQHIDFDINDEDVPLFIQSLENCAPDEYNDLLRNISCVSYASEHSDEYSGAYVVRLKDNSTRMFGWKDSDSLAVLYPFELS